MRGSRQNRATKELRKVEANVFKLSKCNLFVILLVNMSSHQLGPYSNYIFQGYNGTCSRYFEIGSELPSADRFGFLKGNGPKLVRCDRNTNH